MAILRRLNKYIDETTPWVLGKDESKKERLATVMYNLYEGIRISATLLYPFMPSSAEKIIRQINDPENIVSGITTWSDVEKFGKEVPTGSKVNPKPEPLFARIDEEKKMAEINAVIAKAQSEKAKSEKKAEKTEEKKDSAENELINIDDFAKVKLVCAKILSAEPVEKSDKLLKIMAFDGVGERQIVSGIAKSYTPDELVGKKVILVANLKPAKLRGVESNGMLLAAGYKDSDGNEKIHISFLDDNIPEGSVIR
jgi:methionyl-tRNA synthetase